MDFLVTEISKYIILIVTILYCGESVWPLFVKNGDKNRGVYIRQYIYIMLFHTLGMISLYLIDEEKDPMYLFLWFGQLVTIFLVNRFVYITYPKISKMLLNHMCFLLSVGFVILTRIDIKAATRQFAIISASFILFILVISFIKRFNMLQDFTYIFGGVGISLLILVLSMGKVVNGSKLSYTFFGMNIQPSEFVKILFILFIAGMLYENCSFIRVLITSVLAALFVGILALSKDLGSALIYYVAFLVVLYVATAKIWYSLIGLLLGSGAAYFAYKVFTHVQIRLAVWIDPWSDIDKTGYQLTQSLFAIGTGSWFGLGLGKGTPSSIPYVQEDFIFSAICEELGVIFGVVLILICLAVFALFVKISMRTKNKYYKLITIGLSIVYIMQVILTIGGGTRFIPLTGVTLPLVSSGGSSCLSMILLFAIIEGVVILPQKRSNPYYGVNVKELPEEEYNDYKKEKKLDKKRKTGSIVLCTINCIIFLLMIINLLTYMVKDVPQVIENSYNKKRIDLIASANYRGDIISSDGQILATTTFTASGNEVREYPYKNIFAHIVGYSDFGKTGIESSMNSYLIKSDISFSEKVKNDNAKIKNKGDIVYSTLDANMQRLAFELLGVYDGAVVITEAKTGKVIAMVSKPDYDPNTILDKWDKLTGDKTAPLINRASQGLYPPGSTFKIVTALEYIRENPTSYKNYNYTCNGVIKKDDVTINCYNHSVHGNINLTTSMAKSCNTSFANIGLKLSRDGFANTLNELGFNKKLPVEFENNASYCTMRNDMDTEAVMQTAIGQYKTTMSPLHLNMITAAIANGGNMMTPYVVDRVESADGKIIKQFEPKSMGQVMSPEEATILTDMMIQVVENGTGNRLKGESFSVAGKTGSAEFDSSKFRSHAWFTGFAPADDPEIVITIILEDAGTGGEHSVPIARQLFEAYMNNK